MESVLIDDIKVTTNVRSDLGDLEDLTESIRAHGVITPITVKNEGGAVVLVAGRRRLEASRLAGLTDIPAHFVSDGGDGANFVALQITENVQRLDLDYVDQGYALAELSNLGLNQRDIAAKVNLTQSTVSRLLALTRLDPKVQKLVRLGELPYKTAAEIAKITDPKVQIEVAQDPSDFAIGRALDAQEREAALDKLIKEVARADIETADKAPSGYAFNDRFSDVAAYQRTSHDDEEVVVVQLDLEGEPCITTYLPRAKAAATGDITEKAKKLATKERYAQLQRLAAKAKTADVSAMAVATLFERALTAQVAREVGGLLALDPAEFTTYTKSTDSQGEEIERPVVDWKGLVEAYYHSGPRQSVQVMAALLMTIGTGVVWGWMADQGVQDLDTLTQRFLTELRQSN